MALTGSEKKLGGFNWIRETTERLELDPSKNWFVLIGFEKNLGGFNWIRETIEWL